MALHVLSETLSPHLFWPVLFATLSITFVITVIGFDNIAELVRVLLNYLTGVDPLDP